MTEDIELIQQCLDKSDEAWDRLYRKYAGRVRAFVSSPKWRFTPHEAEETVQEIFLQLFRALPQFKQEASLNTFLSNISKHTCISIMRKKFAQKREGELKSLYLDDDDNFLQIEDKGSTPEEILIGREQINRILEKIPLLSRECIEIIKLRYFQNYPYDAISKKFGLPIGTICSRISRCIAKLKKISAEAGE